jgi:sugar lactone lactonase YvrE
VSASRPRRRAIEEVRLAIASPNELGESPVWHPGEQALFSCDIDGRRLQRFDPADGSLAHWQFDTELASLAPMQGGALLLAMRDGLWRFEPATGARRLLCAPPYDPRHERFNDGKCDPQGRFWVGTIYEPREPALASLHCWHDGVLERRLGGLTVSNGLAFSPDGRTLYCSDTRAHAVYAFDFEPASGEISVRRTFASFAPRSPGQALADYGGRPDGAAVDAEGCYWVAMYEGARLLRLSPRGEVLEEAPLPVRCPTMPCFGGPGLDTLYITTARANRPAAELAAEPWAGCMLALSVDVPGLPANFCAD